MLHMDVRISRAHGCAGAIAEISTVLQKYWKPLGQIGGYFRCRGSLQHERMRQRLPRVGSGSATTISRQGLFGFLLFDVGMDLQPRADCGAPFRFMRPVLSCTAR